MNILEKTKKRWLLGLAAVIIASVGYGVQPVILNLCTRSGADGTAVLMTSFAISALITGIILLIRGQRFTVSCPQFAWLIFFGIMGFYLCEALRILSYQTIAVSVSLLFHFCFPVIVTVFLIVVFHEKVTVYKVLAIFLALGGIACMTDFSGGITFSGTVFALLSGVSYGAYIVGAERTSLRNLPNGIIAFYLSLIASCCMLVQCLIRGIDLVLPSPDIYISSVLLSLIGGVIPLYAFTTSIRLLGASTTTVLNNLEPLVGVVVSVVVFSEPVTWNLVGACVLILSGSVVVALDAGGYFLKHRKQI